MDHITRQRRSAGRLAIAWGLIAFGEIMLAAKHTGHLGSKPDPIPDMAIFNSIAATIGLAGLGKNVKKLAENDFKPDFP